MVTFERKSQLTGITHQMTFALSPDDFRDRLESWQEGALIQNAFPMLDADEREFIMTGITPSEWDEAFNHIGDNIQDCF